MTWFAVERRGCDSRRGSWLVRGNLLAPPKLVAVVMVRGLFAAVVRCDTVARSYDRSILFVASSDVIPVARILPLPKNP